MANTPKRLYGNTPGTTVATGYTAPTSTTTIVKNIVLCNTSAADATVDVYIVPSGGTAGVTNAIIYGYTVGAKDTIVMDAAAVLEAGDTLQLKQGTASAIAVYASGVEMS